MNGTVIDSATAFIAGEKVLVTLAPLLASLTGYVIWKKASPHSKAGGNDTIVGKRPKCLGSSP